MFAKALLAFLALPGIVGGVIPALIAALDPWRTAGSPIGYLIFAAGCVVLLWCVRDFYVSGKGTLAPWSPPRNLVIVGLYRFARNPMYVGVLCILLGWSVASGSLVIALYAAIVAMLFHWRVLRHEEPWLAQEFGSDWDSYAGAVRRWMPRLSPWYPDDSAL